MSTEKSKDKQIAYLERKLRHSEQARRHFEILNDRNSSLLTKRYEELEKTNNELKHTLTKLKQKTDEALQASEQARLSQIKAEDAAQYKTEFMANMSHEVRTPLNAILGFTELLHNTPLSELQNDYLAQIDTSSKHLLDLINEILDFEKAEAGKLTLELCEFSPHALFNELSNMFSNNIISKQLDILFALSSNVPTSVVGDLFKLKKVLINLINNAVKFTDQGEIEIRATVAETTDQTCKIVFRVKDSGIGIRTEDQERLFLPFEQADGSTTRRYGGTGLGLSICKQIVELMQGEIWLESEYSKGSCFTLSLNFDLPSAQLDAASPNNYSARNDQSGEFAIVEQNAMHRLIDKDLLLVEDEPINRHLMQEFLKNTGLRLHIAENGKQAIQMAAEHNYDIILMDMQLPVMGGCEAARYIRDELGQLDTPIIALTANVIEGDRDKCYQAGMDDYLTKPVSSNALIKKIVYWINRDTPLRSGEYTLLYLPESAPGINIGKALDLCANRPALLHTLFLNFASNYALAAIEIAQALNRNSFATAHALAHKLVGAAAGIGADGLAETAREIQSLNDSYEKSRIGNLQARLEQQLQQVLDSIHNINAEKIGTH